MTLGAPGSDTDGAGTAIGFPGQGGDWRDALRTLSDAPDHPLVSGLADRLGTHDWERLDPLDTRHAQPVVFASGLVRAATKGLTPASAVLTMGHSLGEITAATWAGAIEPLAGLDLVAQRAALATPDQQARPGAMVAIMRLTEHEVDWLRRSLLAERPGVLDVAVVNSATQVILAGDDALVAEITERANDVGGVARRLPIGGAYHSILMMGATTGFADAVAKAVRRNPLVPVVSSTLARPLTTAAEIADALVRSLVLPVRWPETVAAALDAGATHAIDAGPGDTLVRLARFLPALPFVAA
ncbi:MAG TPA: ACP S-malonyltransferase [Acidimicrobiales bacterium]